MAFFKEFYEILVNNYKKLYANSQFSYKNMKKGLLFIILILFFRIYIIIFQSSLNLFLFYNYLMRSWHNHCHNPTSTSTASLCSYYNSGCETAATWAAYEKCDYLSNINFKLVNEINDAETQKYFYKNKLSSQFKNHTSELEQAFSIISQKNNVILAIEEQLDKIKKDYRVLEADYLNVKNCAKADKEFYEKQKQNIQRKCEQKIKKNQQQLEKQYALKLSKRVTEVQNECEQRVKMYKGQIEQLTQNSNQLTHELKQMQDKYREMLLKNDLTIQQSINRQLRKRDYEAQNNYLRDVSQYQALLKDKNQLKDQMKALQDKNRIFEQQKQQLQNLLDTQKTKYKDLSQAFEFEKSNNKIQLQQKLVERTSAEINTQQPYVPIIMPVDMDLMSEIVSLKEFVAQKIVQRFLQFFCKVAVTDPKKKSYSLMAFKQSMEQLRIANPQNKILLYILTNLQKMIKTFCPAMIHDNKQYLTIKDQFIKKTLMECQTLKNPTQKLYRILQLIHRLRHPITHQDSEISAPQLRLVQKKLMVTLRKVLLAN